MKGTPLETVVYLASWFGLRRGEIVGLRWSSVDLERGVLSITGTVKDKGKSGSKIENLRYEPTAKNATSIRSFPLSDSVVCYFRALKKQQDKNRAADKNYNHQLYHREYHTYEELKKGIDEYILFYNQIRPHKKLMYVSPCEFEEAYYRNLQKK